MTYSHGTGGPPLRPARPPDGGPVHGVHCPLSCKPPRHRHQCCRGTGRTDETGRRLPLRHRQLCRNRRGRNAFTTTNSTTWKSCSTSAAQTSCTASETAAALTGRIHFRCSPCLWICAAGRSDGGQSTRRSVIANIDRAREFGDARRSAGPGAQQARLMITGERQLSSSQGGTDERSVMPTSLPYY